MRRILVPWLVPWLLALAAAGGALVLRGTLATGPRAGEPAPATFVAEDPGHVRGVLRVSLLGGRGSHRQPTRHLHSFVNGPAYSGMEDNDLRGFLDGRFKYSVNQPSQNHVRIGRRGDAPLYGEHELFRVLMRWADLPLPAQARVLRARLEIDVEEGPTRPLRLYLYPVQKDWNPGQGGEHRDNASLPRTGEVWWNDRAFGEAPWGLPGAGFASDADPDADIAASPLAVASWRPGEASLAFEGPELAAYAQARSRAGLPLLFLLKLSDFQEDRPGSVLTLYSGNHGDSGNVARRPRLALEWEGEAESDGLESALFLEYGHVKSLPPLDADGAATLAASFQPAPDSLQPSVEARTDGEGGLTPWRRLDVPIELPAGAKHVELRVTAAPAPIRLGEPFRASLRDTWVVSAPPDQQRVVFDFVSPTGARHEVLAHYTDDWRFEVEFLPDELGPWQYVFDEHFAEKPFRSAVGRFDVVAEDPSDVVAALENLEHQIAAAGQDGSALDPAFYDRFARLERAALRFENPRGYHSAEGEALCERLNRVRAQLGGAAPVPQPLVGLPEGSLPPSQRGATAAAAPGAVRR